MSYQLRNQLLSSDIGSIDITKETPMSHVDRARNGPQFPSSQMPQYQYQQQHYQQPQSRAQSFTQASIGGFMSKFNRKNRKSTGAKYSDVMFGGKGGGGDDDDDDDDKDIEMTGELSATQMSFKQLSNLKDRGRYGGFADHNTAPVIPTIGANNGQNLSTTEYRKLQNTQKKRQMMNISQQRAMSLQTGGYGGNPYLDSQRNQSLTAASSYNSLAPPPQQLPPQLQPQPSPPLPLSYRQYPHQYHQPPPQQYQQNPRAMSLNAMQNPYYNRPPAQYQQHPQQPPIQRNVPRSYGSPQIQQVPPPKQQVLPPNQQVPPPNQQVPPPNQQVPPPNQHPVYQNPQRSREELSRSQENLSIDEEQQPQEPKPVIRLRKSQENLQKEYVESERTSLAPKKKSIEQLQATGSFNKTKSQQNLQQMLNDEAQHDHQKFQETQQIKQPQQQQRQYQERRASQLEQQERRESQSDAHQQQYQYEQQQQQHVPYEQHKQSHPQQPPPPPQPQQEPTPPHSNNSNDDIQLANTPKKPAQSSNLTQTTPNKDSDKSSHSPFKTISPLRIKSISSMSDFSTISDSQVNHKNKLYQLQNANSSQSTNDVFVTASQFSVVNPNNELETNSTIVEESSLNDDTPKLNKQQDFENQNGQSGLESSRSTIKANSAADNESDDDMDSMSNDSKIFKSSSKFLKNWSKKKSNRENDEFEIVTKPVEIKRQSRDFSQEVTNNSNNPNNSNSTDKPVEKLQTPAVIEKLENTVNKSPNLKKLNLSIEQLGIMEESTSLLQELEIVSSELSHSIKREIYLENLLHDRKTLEPSENDYSKHILNQKIEISKLVKELNEQRQKRFIAEEHCLLLENNVKPSALELDYELTSLRNQLLIKDEMISKQSLEIQNLNSKINKNELKQLSKKVYNLENEIIPNLMNELELTKIENKKINMLTDKCKLLNLQKIELEKKLSEINNSTKRDSQINNNSSTSSNANSTDSVNSGNNTTTKSPLNTLRSFKSTHAKYALNEATEESSNGPTPTKRIPSLNILSIRSKQ